MFGGRPFTSQKHPWPLNKKKRPYYPLIQIDLSQVSKITGKDFGHSLMQVWLDITKDSLSDLIRIIDKEDLDDAAAEDFPDAKSIQKIDEFNSWFGISSNFSFKPSGFMMAHWFDGSAEWDYARDLSAQEIGILNELQKLSEDNGYKSLSSNWLLGYPDRGSGSPAGRYYPEPKNFIQFETSDAFPMVDVSRYANIFYSEADGDVAYSFDWNG